MSSIALTKIVVNSNVDNAFPFTGFITFGALLIVTDEDRELGLPSETSYSRILYPEY